MATNSDSFLPRIQSVFYAVFDVRQGPKIVYQVPEGLIAVPSQEPKPTSSAASSTISLSLPPSTPATPSSQTSSSSLISPLTESITSRTFPSPHKQSDPSDKHLFHFDDISKYVIPPSALCGRLVKCATKRHRVIGFPVCLRGEYERNDFRYNLCFVFERRADLSCYEPIVRKIGRVFTSCEEESAFLSKKRSYMHAILEQLYEDLNSYSETSIPIDAFNSLELKIFPFYPNPPPVRDWDVPLALINIAKRVEPNWDLTMIAVCKHIDGVNHVSRIAHLADCDLDLTRQAISHLLYYQVIMMIDIFQYSNMYTLRKSIQWLAEETHVRDECGPYVTKAGRPIPDWPKLLHLYSRLRPGKTVFEWMNDYDVLTLGIDVRRFTSFGVIKGFLRRVHRYPVLLQSINVPPMYRQTSSIGRRRGKSISGSLASQGPVYPPTPQPEQACGRVSKAPPTVASVSTELAISAAVKDSLPNVQELQQQRRRASAAERSLEILRRTGLIPASPLSPQRAQPEHVGVHHNRGLSLSRDADGLERRRYPTAPVSATLTLTNGRARSRSTHALTGTDPRRADFGLPGVSTVSTVQPRPRLSRSPSAPMMPQASLPPAIQGTGALSGAGMRYPKELPDLLDGEHHTDELATRFEAGWPQLEQWLVVVGEGKALFISSLLHYPFSIDKMKLSLSTSCQDSNPRQP